MVSIEINWAVFMIAGAMAIIVGFLRKLVGKRALVHRDSIREKFLSGQREIREALKGGDHKKAREHQEEMTRMTVSMAKHSWKTMAVTMPISLAMFFWILPHFFGAHSQWVISYAVGYIAVSLPLSQIVFKRILKWGKY